MKKAGKKLLAVLAAVALLLCAVPAGSMAPVSAQTDSGDEWEYEVLDDGTADITGYYGNSEHVEIPGKVDGHLVTMIEYAFSENTSLISVIIPDSVTAIGSSAFYGCSSLAAIDLPDSVTSIGDQAFEGCASLTSVIIPDNVTYIGYSAFANCSALVSVTIGAGLDDRYGFEFYSLFSGCRSLNSIYVSEQNAYYCDIDGVLFNKDKTQLNQYPFARQGAYTIPDSVIDMHPYAFYDCNSLTSVTVPDSMTYGFLDGSYFERCSALTAIYVGEQNVDYCDIDGVLFSKDRTQLIRYPGAKPGAYDIPDSVTTVKDGAFSNCLLLTSLTIGKNLTSIDIYHGSYLDTPFSGCSSLTAIYVSEQNEYYCDIDGVLFNKEKTRLEQYPYAKQGPFTIPDSVISYLNEELGEGYGDLNFSGCTGLTELTIPANINSFFGLSTCPALTAIHVDDANPDICDIDGVLFNKDQTELKQYPPGRKGAYTIPDGVTTLAYQSFANSILLSSLTIPDSVTTIKDQALINCTGLSSMTIGNGITTVEGSMFYGGSSVTSVTVSGSGSCILTSWAFPSLKSLTVRDGTTEIEANAFSGLASVESVSIPDSVTKIGGGAFSGWSSLAAIDLPDRLTSIGGSAFSGCSALTEIDLPESVTSIAGGAFSNCSALASMDIPDGVTSIGNNTFSYCSSLTSIALPNQITAIGNDVFHGCALLASIDLPESLTSIGDDAFYGCSSLTSVTVPNRVTSIGDSAFNECSSLASVIIGESVTSIGERAFENCQLLASIDIPDSVKTIGEFAFQWCNSLSQVTFGKGVQSIGYGAFSDCSALTSVAFEGNVATIEENAFSFTPIASLTFGESVTTIDLIPFSSCSSLTAIHVSEKNAYYCDIDGVLFNKEATELIRYPYAKEGAYTVPDSVKTIDEGAFHSCNSLTSVCIGNNVTAIPKYAFQVCRSLTSVTISDSVTTIGAAAFYWCSSLSQVTIGNGVKTVEDYAFHFCNSLKSVSIPASVTEIGQEAFGYSDGYFGDPDFPYPDFTVYGYARTAAEEYANANGFEFIPLSDADGSFGAVDTNGDGEISTAEAQDFYIGFYNALANENPPAGADVNRDGRVDIEDVLTVYLIASGKTIA